MGRAVNQVGAGRWMKPAAAILGLGMLTACGGLGEQTSNLVSTVTSGGQGPIEVSPDAFAAPVYCPPIRLKRNTHLIIRYERGRENDPQGLLYQVILEDFARSCKAEGGDETRVKIGVSGDVTPGPAWQGGEVIVPVRITATGDGDTALFSESINIPVTLGAGAPSETWTLIEDKFTIARNQPGQIEVGFETNSRGRR